MSIAFMVKHTPEPTYRACQNMSILKLAKSLQVEDIIELTLRK